MRYVYTRRSSRDLLTSTANSPLPLILFCECCASVCECVRVWCECVRVWCDYCATVALPASLTPHSIMIITCNDWNRIRLVSAEEIHAELVYAEALLMVSLMTFLGDQNLINLVKGAFRIR